MPIVLPGDATDCPDISFHSPPVGPTLPGHFRIYLLCNLLQPRRWQRQVLMALQLLNAISCHSRSFCQKHLRDLQLFAPAKELFFQVSAHIWEFLIGISWLGQCQHLLLQEYRICRDMSANTCWHFKNPYMFPSPKTGEMYHPDSVVNLHKKILRDAGLGHIRFYDLRHTFATMALQNGVDVKTVSSMLGHFDAGFTLRTYTHATREKQDEAARKMGGLLAQAISEQK